ncbi:MAG: 2-oxoglutarate dehydrogenase E1 component [Candidatus Sumerlaeia bacterium]
MSAMEFDPGSLSLSFIEGLYEDFKRDPQSVPSDWRRYFEGMKNPDGGRATLMSTPATAPRSETPAALTVPASPAATPPSAPASPPSAAALPPEPPAAHIAGLQHRVEMLVHNYRVRAHRIARVDPLGPPEDYLPELDPAYYGLQPEDLDREFHVEFLKSPTGTLTLREIIQGLHQTYARLIGVQFMHIDDLSVRKWLQERMESTHNRIHLSRAEQLRILTRLTDAIIFEEFIQKKYTGAKSFSLEGAESLIPLLDMAIQRAGQQGVEEIMLAMAHRGRLNVLANILGKSPSRIFREFEDKDPELFAGSGDVKYHLGYHAQILSEDGRLMWLALAFNPSHLEFVNPVALGRLRARQDRFGDTTRAHSLAILIHGDAAFIGEGVVQETLNLSELPGYTVGGAIHVIVNNQIGFTTGPEEARSTVYATDVAKMLQSPIFHVNGEAPEAVAQVVSLALDFRRKFKRDVVIDMYCYRRRGHNEGDEPSFTQPVLYNAISRRKSVYHGYLEHLLRMGEVTMEEAEHIARMRRERLEQELRVARSDNHVKPSNQLTGIWAGYCGGPESTVKEVPTAVPVDRLKELLLALTRLPDGFKVHPKLTRWLTQRAEMAEQRRPLDWATAEALAFATLATEGIRVRMSGQDSQRGTFSQRHFALHDYENGRVYAPLQHLSAGQAPVEIINSPLSEAGVLGFEYGYSIGSPDALVIWEAQFGDFVNAAQVILDQFIASAEDKWGRLSGIVLLLPHGFEGQGPEHSSARLERFLTLAAEDNIQVTYPSTPAQFFHLLRRQVLRPWRKPLVVMTPKSLLRHPECTSPLSHLSEGGFLKVIADPGGRPSPVERVLLCTGKIYYDLAAERARLGRENVAIVRVEQLYPHPEAQLAEALAPYPDGTPVFWVQEEPENMGAWRYMRVHHGDRLFGRLPLFGVTRPESASPATGSLSAHKMEQQQILDRAFGQAATGGAPRD